MMLKSGKFTSFPQSLDLKDDEIVVGRSSPIGPRAP